MKILENMTPAERARLKIYSHFAIIFVFNIALAALVYFTGGSGPVNWYTLAVSVVAQAVLALLDSLKKFFTASGEPSISAMLDAARAEIASKAPPAPALPAWYGQAQAAMDNTMQFPTAQILPAPAAQPIQRPAWMQDISRANTPAPVAYQSPTQIPAPAVAQPGNYPPPGAQLLTTIPNLAAIQTPQG